MKWVTTASAWRSGFVGSRLVHSTPLDDFVLAEIVRHGGAYYVEFTRFAPKEARGLGFREFLTIDDAQAWAAAIVRLS